MFNSKLISDKFHKDYCSYQNTRMAVYGTGNNAKAIMQDAHDFNIVCVIEKTPREKNFFGHSVVTIEEAIKLGIEAVVLAAESDIELIIYRRIKEICKKNDVKVYGLHLGDIEKIFEGKKLFGFNKETVDISIVKKEIEEHEVISFDIFDTLLCRRTLIPQDVFLIIQEKIKKLPNFQFRRFHSEIVNDKQNPNLDEIYNFMHLKYGMPEGIIQEYKEAELKTEEVVIESNHEVIDLFNYARKLNKTIYLISDMYLPSAVIEKWLNKFGINDYEAILVSNEYRATKNENLYEKFLDMCHCSSCLHIGDHQKLDGLNAIMYGLDAVVLHSRLEAFKDSKYRSVLQHVNTVNDRSIVGLFMNKICSDPFERDHRIADAKEFGYLFLGPLISAFMTWLIEEIQKNKFTKILFAARDGYLFLKLYQMAIEILGVEDMPEGIYLYTSRRACLRSYCRNNDGLNEILKQYGFSLDDVSRNFSESNNYTNLSEDEIFSKAADEYAGYERYINELKISGGENVGIVDLISGGTCQYYLEKMFLGEATGLYLCRGLSWVNCPSYIKAMTEEHPNDPAAYFSKIEQVTLLEAVMTSPEPSLAGFYRNGTPKFLKDKSTANNKEFVSNVQTGITKFFEEYMRYLYVPGCPLTVGVVKELLDYRNIADIDSAIFENIFLEDELLGVQFGKNGNHAKNT